MTAWIDATIDAVCNVEYGTRVVQKRNGGTVYPVYGGGGATFRIDSWNREDRVVIARFGMSPECTRFISGQFFLNDSGLTLSPKNTSALLPQFLDRLVLGLNDAIFQLGKGAAQKNLDVSAFRGIRISYPRSTNEQRRIVAIIDEAFDAIATAKANTNKNLLNVVEVFNQQHDMFFADHADSPERLRLSELATFRNGVNFTKQSKGQAVQIIGVKDFQKHFWVPLDDLDTVTLDGDLSPIDTVSEGDILTVRSNGNPELIGRCMVVGSLTEPTTHSGFTIRISLDRSKAAPTYVCQFLRSRAVRRKLIDGGNGLNIKSLNQGMLAEIAVPLPSLEVQHKIVTKIEALATATHELANLGTRKLAALDELKKSLLHQAFTGKLTAKSTDKQLESVA